MPSFRTSLTPNKRAAARFVVGVRRTLLKALADENGRSGITQTAIARALGVHRSVINRELRGSHNLTLGRVGELAWALGLEPKLTLEKSIASDGQNTSGNMTISPHASPAPAANDVTSLNDKLNARALAYVS
jgi:plasmid maintenance system antidote protein VapI